MVLKSNHSSLLIVEARSLRIGSPKSHFFDSGPVPNHFFVIRDYSKILIPCVITATSPLVWSFKFRIIISPVAVACPTDSRHTKRLLPTKQQPKISVSQSFGCTCMTSQDEAFRSMRSFSTFAHRYTKEY